MNTMLNAVSFMSDDILKDQVKALRKKWLASMVHLKCYINTTVHKFWLYFVHTIRFIQ